MRENRFTSTKGFTLIELLIVFTIVAILVVVSIPIFRAKMEKARETVDIHVMRSAASLAQEFYYAGIKDEQSAKDAGMSWYKAGTDSNAGSNAFAIYVPQTGTFYGGGYDKAINEHIVEAYGKGGKLDGEVEVFDKDGNLIYDPTLDYTKAVCQVSIFPNGSNKRVEVAWKKLQHGSRPFVGNGERGKYINKYNNNNYPRLTIPLE